MDVLFGILWSTGATTLEDLMDLDIRDLAEVHNYIVSLPPETQRSVRNVLMRLAVCSGESVKEKFFMQIFGNRRKTEDKWRKNEDFKRNPYFFAYKSSCKKPCEIL